MKNALDGSMVNFCQILYIERKWFLRRKWAKILSLNSKLSGKFQRLNAINGSAEMLKSCWISKNFN